MQALKLSLDNLSECLLKCCDLNSQLIEIKHKKLLYEIDSLKQNIGNYSTVGPPPPPPATNYHIHPTNNLRSDYDYHTQQHHQHRQHNGIHQESFHSQLLNATNNLHHIHNHNIRLRSRRNISPTLSRPYGNGNSFDQSNHHHVSSPSLRNSTGNTYISSHYNNVASPPIVHQKKNKANSNNNNNNTNNSNNNSKTNNLHTSDSILHMHSKSNIVYTNNQNENDNNNNKDKSMIDNHNNEQENI
eukprot:TRINITY_DN14395_c0_g1_i1.p1 TRINITY_DN14395_c0_g1~~TRINITY_DN14395_c0_g1_i1.p1  ORF type:complete len:244 (-),score=57.47 TRINITY_DN14395_c0_g1_i1:2-733(-)